MIIQNNDATDNGGGAFISGGLNQFINVDFVGNTAKDYGGGLYSTNSILVDVTFNNNIAGDDNSTGYGGAVYNGGTLIVNEGSFYSNQANGNGGAIYSSNRKNFNLIDTVFNSNTATNGGAIYNHDADSSSTIVNSIFNDNRSSKLGGAIYNKSSSTVGTNLTFVNNNAESGAAVYSSGNKDDKPTYRNSIFWNNQGTQDKAPVVNSGANTVIANSIVEGDYDGREITDKKPLFADLGSGDLRLQSDSPAIDAGLNDFVVRETDLIGNARITDEKVDLGVYEYFADQDLSSDAGTIGDSDIPVVEELLLGKSAESRLQLTEVHRFYQSQKGFHFYTASDRESDNVQAESKAGNLKYNYEGESFAALASNKDSLTGEVIEDAKEVYRFFNSDTGAHLLTMDVNEKDFIVENLSNYNLEGIAYYAFTEPQENIETIPVYRMLNTQTNTHLLTVDTNEVNSIKENLPHFESEGDNGITFYVMEL